MLDSTCNNIFLALMIANGLTLLMALVAPG